MKATTLRASKETWAKFTKVNWTRHQPSWGETLGEESCPLTARGLPAASCSGSRPVLYRPCRPTTEALPPPALLKRSKEAGSGGRPMAGGGGEPARRAPRVPGCGCGRAARSREGRGPPRRQPPLAARPVCRNSLSSLGLLEASLKGRAFLQLLSFDVPDSQNLSLLLPICLSTLYNLQSSKNAILAVFITKS